MVEVDRWLEVRATCNGAAPHRRRSTGAGLGSATQTQFTNQATKQRTPTNTNEHQPTPSNTNQHQATPSNTKQHQPTPSNTKHPQLTPTKQPSNQATNQSINQASKQPIKKKRKDNKSCHLRGYLSQSKTVQSHLYQHGGGATAAVNHQHGRGATPLLRFGTCSW